MRAREVNGLLRVHAARIAPMVPDNALVRDLIGEGEGAHRRGGFARCSDSHGGGLAEIDD